MINKANRGKTEVTNGLFEELFGSAAVGSKNPGQGVDKAHKIWGHAKITREQPDLSLFIKKEFMCPIEIYANFNTFLR